ncbi:gluconolactonase [Burkholderia paludis]|uniref:SMP-30/gluconolactonase/LRE family protein n=1 Tax=Burkholderia paludis TaxID=1506587 RepID=UPI0004DB9404|nr:SMP-30/gluconolactonase/LRE family protein [Burkholderia paludis]KFG94156.1 gluconolactonase [Burkholderia paludis]
MTHIQTARAPNPLKGWQVGPDAVKTIGHDLQRPECILAERDGTLWAADARGGVMRIDADGGQTLVTSRVDSQFDLQANAIGSLVSGTLPNGLAFADNGDILIANFGTDRLERMTRRGETSVLADSIDGKPLGKVNFVLRDSRNRIWLTVSTRVNPWTDAVCHDLADGYIAVLDQHGLRVVADGLHFANEIRFDAREEWLYVAETTAKRVTRFRVQSDGALTERQVYGPRDLGPGLIDGITFDSYGNLWATMIFADRLIAITPEGDALTLFADGDEQAQARFEAEFASGKAVTDETLFATGGTLCTWMASVTFGGPDLTTVFLGGLRASAIPCFDAPVRGLPPVHW